MSVVSRLSCLLIPRFHKWDSKGKGISEVLSPSPAPSCPSRAAPVSSAWSFLRHLGVTQFHKPSLPRLTRSWHQQFLQVTPPRFHSFLHLERTAKFSLADFPGRGMPFPHGVWGRFRWYFLGSKLLWNQAQISLEAGRRRRCSRFTHPGREQVRQEEPQCSSAVFSFASIPTHIKTRAGLETWSL